MANGGFLSSSASLETIERIREVVRAGGAVGFDSFYGCGRMRVKLWIELIVVNVES